MSRGVEEIRRHARVVALLITVVFLWFLYSRLDPCNGKRILANMCKEYSSGEISGRLCVPLCREESIFLSYCQDKGERKSFLWENMVMRISPLAQQRQRELTLVEGMLPSEFHALLLDHLRLKLGPGEYMSLTRRLKKFADFNEDGKLSLGEAQSLWRLLHDHEFLILFIFQHSYVFPSINGTCGSLFGFSLPEVSAIYDKNTFPLHLLSEKAYRWSLPSWEKRAKVAVGLLDLMFDIYEEDHIRFFMCDLKSTSIGHTDTYEAVLTNLEDIKSGTMLATAMENRTCAHDHQCHYTKYCTTMCDTLTQVCSGEVTKPTLWQACHLLKEYLLFDAPEKLKPTLEKLLYRCAHLIIYGQSIDMSHVVLITDLKAVLWDQIKNRNVR
nr:hypothetical protein BaRGS_003403 [Batillaria attramentaria]